jgi:hypothetical protein
MVSKKKKALFEYFQTNSLFISVYYDGCMHSQAFRVEWMRSLRELAVVRCWATVIYSNVSDIPY